METNNLIDFLKEQSLLLLYILPFLIAGYYILKKWGKNTLKNDRQQEENEYETMYAEINHNIDEYPEVPGNYEALEARINILKELPYKNDEKTEVLERRLLKFQKTEQAQYGAPFDDDCFNLISVKEDVQMEPSDDELKKAEEKILALSN
jgi:uncharacterized protein YneF (UPF0154 family)